MDQIHNNATPLQVTFWNPYALPLPKNTITQRALYYPADGTLSPLDFSNRLPSVIRELTGDIIILFPIHVSYLACLSRALLSKGYHNRTFAASKNHTWIFSVKETLCAQFDKEGSKFIHDNCIAVFARCIVRGQSYLFGGLFVTQKEPNVADYIREAVEDLRAEFPNSIVVIGGSWDDRIARSEFARTLMMKGFRLAFCDGPHIAPFDFSGHTTSQKMVSAAQQSYWISYNQHILFAGDAAVYSVPDLAYIWRVVSSETYRVHAKKVTPFWSSFSAPSSVYIRPSV